jgi:hypothetical protein
VLARAFLDQGSAFALRAWSGRFRSVVPRRVVVTSAHFQAGGRDPRRFRAPARRRVDGL